MFTLKSISYFTDHNLLRCMPQELLFRLLYPYTSFFREHDIELPTVWREGCELPIDAICIALMNVRNGERSIELIEELMMLQALMNGKELIDRTLDLLVSENFPHIPELQRQDKESDADYILKLWLHPEMRIMLEELVPWLQAKAAKAFAEFPLRESLCPNLEQLATQQKGTEEERKNSLEKLGISGLVEIVNKGLADACSRIGAHFKMKGYTDFCEIKYYPSEENNEIVFIVDHSGKQQRVNTLSKEKQKDITSYIPLLNDVVVLMPERALLRVSTKMTWSESLYREVFGLLLLNDKYAFEIRELYHFSPMFHRAPATAFTLTGFHNIIRAVELKCISYTENDINIGSFVRHDNQKSLMRAAYLQKGAPLTLQKVVLALTMKDRSSSRPVTVTIQSGKGKGLGCTVDKYYDAVHKWISNLGFRLGISNTKTLRLLDDASQDTATKVHWKKILDALLRKNVTKNYLEKVCGARVRLFLDKYLIEEPDSQIARVWYENEKEAYNIVEHDGSYVIVNSDNIFEVFGEISDIEDIILHTIDKQRIFKDIYGMFAEHLRKSPELAGSFLYGGSLLNRKSLSVWLFLPISEDDMSHYELLRLNRRRCGQSCIVLPRSEWQKSDDWFQKVYLDDLLEIDEAGQMQLKSELGDLVDDRCLYGQDGPPYRKWHLRFPESRDWAHIDIKLGYDIEAKHTTLHITYGAEERAPQANLKHSDITAFTKQSEDFGWKKEFRLLLQIANQMNTKGYFYRGDSRMGTQLNRLADILAEYFCLDGLFYEEVPHTEDARKRFRTKFQVSVASSLKALLDNSQECC